MSTNTIFSLLMRDRLFRKSTPGQGSDSELDQVDEYYSSQMYALITRFMQLAKRYEDPARNLTQGVGRALWSASTFDVGTRISYSDLIDLDIKKVEPSLTTRKNNK